MLLFPGDAPRAGGDGAAGPHPRTRRGVPSEGLDSVATVDAADVGLNFRGQVTAAEAGAKADGDLERACRQRHARSPRSSGLAPPLRLDGVPVSARLKLALAAARIGMDKLALQVGESRLSGKIMLSPGAERRRIDARLDADEIDAGHAAEPAARPALRRRRPAEAVLSGRPIPWPDEPFSASVLDAFEGQIRLSCQAPDAGGGHGPRGRQDRRGAAAPEASRSRRSSAALSAAQVKAAVSIEKAPAGAEVRGASASASCSRTSRPARGARQRSDDRHRRVRRARTDPARRRVGAAGRGQDRLRRREAGRPRRRARSPPPPRPRSRSSRASSPRRCGKASPRRWPAAACPSERRDLRAGDRGRPGAQSSRR